MTEHTRIPVPKGNQGLSLFERAESLFGDQGFVPAKVPTELSPPNNRIPPSRKGPVKRLPREDAAADPLAEAFAAPKAQPPVAPPVTPPVAPPVVEQPFVAPEPAPQPVAQPVTQPAAPAPVVQPAYVPEPVFERVELPTERHEIDRELLARHGLINPDGAVTGLMEEFRIVKRQLLKAARADATGRSRRILVCSPLPSEGKTFCTVNLALAMAAERDCEVVLVDGDVAKPSILSMLGLPKGPGLMDALANPDIAIEDCIIATDIAGFHVLPAGNQTSSDSEYLASKEMGQLLDRLTIGARERVLVFDSPPALAASPAADIARHVGQVMVVARADQTGQSALEDALTLLSGCPDIKLLLNDAHFSPSGRRFGGYYGYGG